MSHRPDDQITDGPPGSWAAARRLVRSAIAPVERFLAVEAASGVVLLMASAIAVVWANSPWRAQYFRLWQAPIVLQVGPFVFARDLQFWVNDGLMSVFFFVVGLEIRSEMHHGELSDRQRATLPLVAALGGMLVPAGIYAAFNYGEESIRGWGIPMATDIAFAVGVLALLGPRVPRSVRVLLLALAVIDDLGAILVIALFYSAGISIAGGLAALGALLVIGAFWLLGARSPWLYVPPALVVWGGTYAAGVHPTIAGVVVGLMTPARAWLGKARFIDHADASVAALREDSDHDEPLLLARLDQINRARREAVSPLARIQHALHGWVAFGIMPLFAFANAGVELGGLSPSAEQITMLLGVGLGLVVGKPAGILGASWLAIRTGAARLPSGASWRQLVVVGGVGGIGFTMALFIAQLAFPSGPLLETAKLAILIASGFAGLGTFALGRIICRPAR